MFLESLIAKFGRDFIDVIKAIPARDNSGTYAFVCEIAAVESVRIPGVDLATFARATFGTGRLRKIGENLFAVLRPAPVQPTHQAAPTFPTWVFHV